MMVDWLVGMIYIGGVFSMDGEKIGFWKRFAWPVGLGERLAEIAWGKK